MPTTTTILGFCIFIAESTFEQQPPVNSVQIFLGPKGGLTVHERQK